MRINMDIPAVKDNANAKASQLDEPKYKTLTH